MPRISQPLRLLAVVAVVVATVGTLAAPAGAARRTSTATYYPWTHAGTLETTVRVAGAAKGYCWTGSIAVDSAAAYRCFRGNEIYDPCFAPPGAPSSVKEVACVPAPWDKAVLLHLTRPLTAAKHPGGKAVAWADVLGNGRRCVVGTGANGKIAGVIMAFYCSPSGATSVPRTKTEPWTVRYAASYTAKTLVTEHVTTAWY